MAVQLSRWPAAVILLANALAGLIIYVQCGWHFIRGYDEVGNFVVVGLISILAALNAAAAVLVGGWLFVSRRWKAALRTRSLLIGFVASAVLLFSSPLFVPSLGRFANHHGVLQTPLVEAAIYGDGQLVTRLVANGVDPNVRHVAFGTTALHYMAYSGSHDVVELLLEKGADPNARAKVSLETPLHWAVKGRANLRTIELLAKYGADRSLENNEGETPLDYAMIIPDPEGSAIFRVFNGTGKPGENR